MVLSIKRNAAVDENAVETRTTNEKTFGQPVSTDGSDIPTKRNLGAIIIARELRKREIFARHFFKFN